MRIPRTNRLIGPLAILISLILSAPSLAFIVQTYEGDDGPVRLKWRSDRVTYFLNGAGSQDMEPEIAFEAIRQSFETWSAVESSRLQFVEGGVDANATANRRDRRNVIIFDETGGTLQAPEGTGIIAVTRLNSDVSTGAILDADIIYNGRDFTFSLAPRGGQIDLVDVTVHEIGHFIGLDHTPLTGSPSAQPTMNPFYSGSPGEAASLAPDDIAGVSHLYPTSTHTSTTGTVSGAITDPDGTPIFGAHVVAEALDGSLISTLSGAETGRDDPGRYTLRGLPVGDYMIRTEPFAHGITEDNFSGIFTNLATDIPAEYYDNVTRPGLAQTITVPTGALRHVHDIDFVTGLSLPGYPFVSSLLEPANTPDAQGPYDVRARVTGALDVDLLVETTHSDGQRTTTTTPMSSTVTAEYEAQIVGQPVGSQIQYRIAATGEENRVSYFPGPETWLAFDVVSLSGAPLVFTVVRSAGAVRIFDTGSDLEISRVTVGEDPIQMVSSLDGHLLFIADLATSQIAVLDRATFQIVERIDVAAAPLDMTVSADGTTLYVTNSDAGRLTAIDIDSLTRTNSWIVGPTTSGPYGVATGASGRIYLTDLNADELVIIENGQVTQRLAGPSQPRALARSADGATIFVSSFDTGFMGRISDEDGSVTAVDLGVQGTFAVLAHPSLDRVYLTAHLDDMLLILEASSGRIVERIDVGNDPRGLSLSPNGSLLYVTSATSDEIHIFDTQTSTAVGIYNAAGGPRGIAVVESPDTRSTAIDVSTEPGQWSLSALYPNPFNPDTQLRISAGSDGGTASVRVYNALGQQVRTLLSEHPLVSGQELSLPWDGRDGNGRNVASGIYLFVLETPSRRFVRKGLLLR